MNNELRLFARFVAGRLLAIPQDPGYNWHFLLRQPPVWLPPAPHEGITLAHATQVLQCASRKLHEAVAAEDHPLLLESIATIMAWGKVWHPQGPRRNNEAAVTALADAGTLVRTVRDNLDALARQDYAAVDQMNAGWTKVYAAAFDDDRFVIYDSRVSGWLCGQVVQWESLGNDRPGVVRYLIRQTATSGRRQIAGYPATGYGSARPWVESMVHASQVVAEVLRLGREAPEFATAWFRSFTMRELEARLFMLGA